MQATEINDLIVDSEERELLWTALKDRGLKAEANFDSGPSMQVDFAILCALGNLGVLFNDDGAENKHIREEADWKFMTVPEADVRNDIDRVITRIEAEVKKLGGSAPE